MKIEKLSIGRVAKLTNNTVATVHYYEAFGLLTNIERSPAGYRIYSQDAVLKINFIGNAKKLGFKLKDIKKLLDLQSEEVTSQEIKQMTNKRIDDLEKKIQALQEMKKILLSLEKLCDGKMPIDQCPILNKLYSLSI